MANFQLRACFISEIPLLLLLIRKIGELSSLFTQASFPDPVSFHLPRQPKEGVQVSNSSLRSSKQTQAELRDTDGSSEAVSCGYYKWQDREIMQQFLLSVIGGALFLALIGLSFEIKIAEDNVPRELALFLFCSN